MNAQKGTTPFSINPWERRLQLVVVLRITHVLNTRNLNLETLALTHLLDDLADLGGAVKRRATGQGLPVVEDKLGEGLSGGGLAQVTVEAEGLHDGEVGLDGEQRSAGTLLLTEDVTTSAGKDTVDTTHGLLGNLDLDQEDGLEKGGLGEQSGGVQDSAGGGDDLATTTVNGIGVEGDIHDVPADGTHGLLGNGTLAGGPLETRDDGVLDFVEVLDGLGLVDEQVGASGVGTEGPDLTGVSDVPAEVVSQDTSTGLEIVTGADLAGLDLLGELLVDGLSDHVDTVVLVGRLGQSSDAGLANNGLAVLDDGVGDDEGNTGVVVLEIVQANLQVELTSTGNNVLTRLGGHGQDARVGLGETLETLNELGEILGVLDLDGALDNGGDGELHDLEVVGGVGGGESTRLEQELVNTNETDNVTGRHVVDGLDLATHHQDGTLDSLDEKVLLLAGGVVGALDADLDTRLDGTGEDTTESVEATLVRGGNHLGDVKHEGTLGVAVTDGNGSLIGLDTVLLGRDGGGKVENHHLQEGVGSGQESAHDGLEELLALLLAVLSGELEVELLEEGGDLVLLEVHDGGEDLEDGVQDELVEGTLKLLALVGALGGPLLGVGVEVVVAPETLHHLVAVNAKLLGVADSELADGESPAVQTGTEGDGTLVGVNLDITEGLVEVGGDDDVDGLDSTREGLVEVLLGDLELEKSTVNLVDDDDGLDALTESLTQDSLGLDAHTLDGVNDDESTIGDTESGSDFGGEINVTGGVDQVDEEVGAVGLLASNVLDVLGVDVVVQGDGSRLDGNATLLLVGTGIRGSRVSGLGGGDDTGLGQKGVGEGRLSVIDVSNDGHVTDVRGLVHEPTDLLDGEAVVRPWLAS
ncbi:elongation factor 2 [Colletotrichum tofieldiae]|nr:elongation factor 2 [Colletotrichum tofieldiae]